jgi:hypothetical protein
MENMFDRRRCEKEKWEQVQQVIADEFAKSMDPIFDDFAALRRVKSLVFRRLNSARDRRDKKAVEIYREIQEAMR